MVQPYHKGDALGLLLPVEDVSFIHVYAFIVMANYTEYAIRHELAAPQLIISSGGPPFA